ncbi:21110_t:CDS:2, partial [Gigaspora rosea]
NSQYQKAADMGNMGSTNKPLQKLMKDRPAEAVEEAEIFQVIAQEYFTEDSDEEMEVTNWIRRTEWEGWEEVSDNRVSDTEYSYEDYEESDSEYLSEEYEWELDNSQRAQDRQGEYHSDENSTYQSTHSPQPMDIDEWGESTTGLEFEKEEEVSYDTPKIDGSSFTWNQT